VHSLAFVPARQDEARASGEMQCFIAGFAVNILLFFQVLCLTVLKNYSNTSATCLKQDGENPGVLSEGMTRTWQC
jgi:hypothetical protein